MNQHPSESSPVRPRTRAAVTIAAVVLSAGTFSVLPEHVRVVTRIALAVHAGMIGLLAAELTPLCAGLLSREQRRLALPILAAVVAFFIGRIMDVLYRWSLDWPGMWNFLGLVIVIWTMFRYESAE